ncbi:MAG: hypothetical protein EOS65_18695 [Mesorhizobium sp.]|uniref:hypothetical protein n=1 Tax=Mesorhizobium sp. TaxID=1871066 RepID=UPI000FD31BFA|nr:hypothetical protein [Mesorhizobium sp.]RVC60944.1 hypothetical protein EN779_11960 [Mesorhizobium sp. M4B.F.Ca.ET.088.02.2.1]RWF28340.1 MAG: hypothetical protein EOS45_22645 [Mesorhizobium sp.]RWF39648.1 MAG: hypothetical protein EOS65_18695 [Mesorhizobium sp.]TIX12862.1 MAG: hypothetical protein E5V41_22870 [Mesorhizobium sp.]TIX41542.1 MAG: hypothetical protein E5V40_09955 [Mesorhizobium sp.]
MTDKDAKPRRHVNRSEKLALRAADIAVFVSQYGRKAQKGIEPNDRRFDEDVERRIKRMDPVELDHLIRDDEE